MKKIIFISLLSSLFLFAACGSSTSKSMASSTASIETNFTDEISSQTISSTKNSQVQDTVRSSEPSQANSETTATTASNNNEQYVFTSDQEQALQLLYKDKPELKNPDINFAFFKMIGSDYLFKATSISIRQQGGSGTIGFYRISPQGTVTETDPSGNPY